MKRKGSEEAVDVGSESRRTKASLALRACQHIGTGLETGATQKHGASAWASGGQSAVAEEGGDAALGGRVGGEEARNRFAEHGLDDEEVVHRGVRLDERDLF